MFNALRLLGNMGTLSGCHNTFAVFSFLGFSGLSQFIRKIVVVNAKGGSGKTTLSTNLAACYASRGNYPALLDYDVQGSAMNWLSLRTNNRAPIHGVNACKKNTAMTRSFQMRMPDEIDKIIVDTPSAASSPELAEYVRQASVIIVPVLPSPIDIHAVINFLKEILLFSKMRSIVSANKSGKTAARIGVVANRVQDNTSIYDPLQTFLTEINVPFVAILHDNQYYSHAFSDGVGVHELEGDRTRSVCKEWQPLMKWIDESDHSPSHASTTSREQFDKKYNL